MCILHNIASSFHCHRCWSEFKMLLPPAKTTTKDPGSIREIQVHKLWTKVYSQNGLTAMHYTLQSTIQPDYILAMCHFYSSVNHDHNFCQVIVYAAILCDDSCQVTRYTYSCCVTTFVRSQFTLLYCVMTVVRSHFTPTAAV